MNILIRFCSSAILLAFAASAFGYAQSPTATLATKPIPGRDGSVRGVVRTVDGKPAANASVWVIADFFGAGPRRLTFSTQADKKGMYQFNELPNPKHFSESNSVSLLILAKTENIPISKTTLTDTTGKSTAPDIIYATPNAAVSISLKTAAESPAAGVAVMLIAQDDPLIRPGTNGDNKAYNALIEQLRPRALTDADGNVRFPHLLAGKYRVVVTKTMDQLDAINRGYIAFVPPPTENFEQRFDLNLPAGHDTAISYRLGNK